MTEFARAKGFLRGEGWQPLPFQIEAWRAIGAGKSGLVHAPTGTGKTYAVWLGILEAVKPSSTGLRCLWITPLRALAADTTAALQTGADGLGTDWRIELRTGDSSGTDRQRQMSNPPQCLVTTPESLSVMLANRAADDLFQNLDFVVVDEWHELLGSKRGVQTELCLAHLRAKRPELATWGISATLANLHVAARVLVGAHAEAALVQGEMPKDISIESLIPADLGRLPWAGHLGDSMIPAVVQLMEEADSCLIFCNTRSQTELWLQGILNARPDWRGQVEIHHGSLDREVRDAVEKGLKAGKLRAVVCTSSLDLGVDFAPVELVVQIGSPKGIARILQRAGRSGHRPGAPSRIVCVPTHAMELVDISAVRYAAERNQIEGRTLVRKPLDLLAQHLVTLAIGGGFYPQKIRPEIQSTAAYADLTDDEWQWTLDFITRGGQALRAYDEFQKVGVTKDGLHIVKNRAIAQRHLMNIGTIVSDSAVNIQFVKGGRLGSVEESFVAKLKNGDTFVFSGRLLEVVQMKDLTVYVKLATKPKGSVPAWAGGRMPLSTQLAHSIRHQLDLAHHGELASPEMEAAAEPLAIQARWSAIPTEDQFLIERLQTSEGYHLFFYPLEGRLVHEGLAALFAYRISRCAPISFSSACNDYGFELLSDVPAPLEDAMDFGLVSTQNLLDDIRASLNAAELSRRQFREIARISGLVLQTTPGRQKSARQIQSSSGLMFDVLSNFDQGNLLVEQAEREVLERQLEHSRLVECLMRLQRSELRFTEPTQPTPFGFPILVDRLRNSVSSESAAQRIERYAVRLEALAREE